MRIIRNKDQGFMFKETTFPVNAKERVSELILETNAHRWVIPYSCEILKAIIIEKKLHAADLQFKSKGQCQGFIKQLLLLAARDENRYSEPSKIAELARELICQQAQLQRNSQQNYL